MLTALHWLYITCDQAVLLPFFLGGEGTFALSIKEKKGLITGYIVYEPIQFSDAGVVHGEKTASTVFSTFDMGHLGKIRCHH